MTELIHVFKVSEELTQSLMTFFSCLDLVTGGWFETDRRVLAHAPPCLLPLDSTGISITTFTFPPQPQVTFLQYLDFRHSRVLDTAENPQKNKFPTAPLPKNCKQIQEI